MIRLYIENSELELTESVQFAITSQFENLSNPTDIINDWSKTVSIPFTTKNDRIFGHIYCPDKTIVDGGTVGVYFNPLKKLDFRLEWNNNIVMVGYAKLNEVKKTKGNGTYELTLFGELGKVFQEMKKITFDTTSTDTDYIIDGSEYVSEQINKELVYDSWCYGGQYRSILKKKTDDGYNVNDIIGFAPNNSFSEGFEYKTFQVSANTSEEFTNVLGTGFTADTGIEPSTAIPNGMLPREIGEYRSYYQLPYIYWNKLFQVFKAKSEEITGYDFELDEKWFNDSNPYWYNLVYMLKPLNSIKNTIYNNIYDSSYTSPLTVYASSGERYHYSFSLGDYEPGFSWSVQNEQIPLLKNPEQAYSHYFEFKESETIDGHLSVKFKMNIACNLSSSKNVHIRNNAVFVIDVYMTDAAIGHAETIHKNLGRICVKWSDSSYVASNSTYTVNVPTQTIPSGSYTWTVVNQDFTFEIPSDLLTADVKFSFKLNGWHAETAFSGSLFVDSNPSSVDLGDITLNGTPNSLNLNITPLMGKSFSNFTLNDLWNKDYNLFDEILKYCKMYRIAVNVDDIEKKIIFKPYTEYFKDYKILDWRDKVDYSKDFIIKPVSFENKYVLFNYKDSKTKQAESYKTKYGVNYGEYRLQTDYNFNTDTVNLFKDVNLSISNTDNVLSWTNLYDYHNITYSFPAEIFVYNKDKDNKQVDIFGSYYFNNGLGDFSTEETLHLRSVRISDDTKFQQTNNTYFYTQEADTTIPVSTYPLLDIVHGDNICLFNVPNENYTYINNYSDKGSIYSNLWENYLNERYNVQNKKITCYVNMKPYEYCQFDWNNFVRVGNQICIVNKIYDYDISNNGTTKVDLITVQDFDGYTKNNYTYDYIIATPQEITIPYDYFKEIEIKSNRDWEIKSDDWRDTLVAFPESGTSGITKVIIGTTNDEMGGTITFESYDENYNVVASTAVPVSLGGTTNFTVTPWYNEISIGGTGSITMSASTSWSVYKLNKHGNDNRKVTVSPSTGSTGTTTITVSVPIDSAAGMVDVYIKDNNSDIITSFRIMITN